MPVKLTATTCLIAINVLVFIFATYVSSTKELLQDSLSLYFPQNSDYRIWQYVTYMFMHGGPAHIFMNMFGLFSFGMILERIWGVKRFLLFYFVVGIGAGIVYIVVNTLEYNSTRSALVENGVSESTFQILEENQNHNRFYQAIQLKHPAAFKAVGDKKVTNMLRNFVAPAVGASGAIYGILTAFGILFPNAKLSLIFLPVPVAAKYFVPALIGLDLFSGFTGFSLFGGGIAHFAHIGGALIGFLLMMLWKNTLPPIEMRT